MSKRVQILEFQFDPSGAKVDPFWLEIPLRLGFQVGTLKAFKSKPITEDLLILGASSDVPTAALVQLATSESDSLMNDFVPLWALTGDLSENVDRSYWPVPLHLPANDVLHISIISQPDSFTLRGTMTLHCVSVRK